MKKATHPARARGEKWMRCSRKIHTNFGIIFYHSNGGNVKKCAVGTKANPRLYRAYLLKEGLRLALKAGSDEISEALTKWMGWAQRCRIPAFRELRLKIKRHFKAIVAAATHGLSNARIEATNNKIKLIIRRAYGFRNMDNMIAMIMLSCSSVHPSLPGR